MGVKQCKQISASITVPPASTSARRSRAYRQRHRTAAAGARLQTPWAAFHFAPTARRAAQCHALRAIEFRINNIWQRIDSARNRVAIAHAILPPRPVVTPATHAHCSPPLRAVGGADFARQVRRLAGVFPPTLLSDPTDLMLDDEKVDRFMQNAVWAAEQCVWQSRKRLLSHNLLFFHVILYYRLFLTSYFIDLCAQVPILLRLI